MAKKHNPYYKWNPIIAAAREIVASYDTLVTLRQLFYRLVAASLILNNDSHYSRLSDLTAEGRRDGTFPDLIDNTRWIHRLPFHHSALEAIQEAAADYRGDRLGRPAVRHLSRHRKVSRSHDAIYGNPSATPSPHSPRPGPAMVRSGGLANARPSK